jgi:hypothetical protein
MKPNNTKIKIVIVICTLYGAQVSADNFTSDELAKSIVKIQKTKPNIDPNSREGEKSYAEWTAKKNVLEKQIDGKTISGTCIYRGRIMSVEGRIDCQAGNVKPQTNEYLLCSIKALENKGASVAQFELSRCGPPSSSEYFSLRLNSETAVNIRKIYDNDKIKFTGTIEYCEIHYSNYANGNDVASFNCSIKNTNAELAK